MIFIRADANSQIGAGHIMRCLSIAHEAKKLGIESTFVVADEESLKVLSSYNYPTICLYSKWDQLEEEVNAITTLIKDLKVKFMIIDSYYITNRYLDAIHQFTQIVYIDDLAELTYPVDFLINYNIYSNATRYPSDIKLLLGCDYVPLRAEFQNIASNIKYIVGDVMISTGGADPYNFAGEILEYILHQTSYSKINFHVIIGKYNKYKNKLLELEKRQTNIILHHNVRNMSDLMVNCDIAITAGGSTLYELCSCGTPSISYSFADNQLLGVKEFNKQDLITYAGDIRLNKNECIGNINKRLLELVNNYNLREEVSLKLRGKVDGLGANRIVTEIIKYFGGQNVR